MGLQKVVHCSVSEHTHIHTALSIIKWTVTVPALVFKLGLLLKMAPKCNESDAGHSDILLLCLNYTVNSFLGMYEEEKIPIVYIEFGTI